MTFLTKTKHTPYNRHILAIPLMECPPAHAATTGTLYGISFTTFVAIVRTSKKIPDKSKIECPDEIATIFMDGMNVICGKKRSHHAKINGECHPHKAIMLMPLN